MLVSLWLVERLFGMGLFYKGVLYYAINPI